MKPHLPIYSLLIQAEYNAVPYRMCRSMWNVDISRFQMHIHLMGTFLCYAQEKQHH